MADSFNRASVSLTTTSDTVIYTAPTSAGSISIVLSCFIANTDGASGCDVTLQIQNSSSVRQAYLAKTIPIPADASFELVANKLVLKAGEKLVATASSANRLDASVSVLEMVV